MYNKDNRILEPLDSMTEKLEKVIRYLAYFDLTVEKLRELAPFKKEHTRKVRNVIRGGLTSPTRRNLIKLNRLIYEVDGLMNFYVQYGGRVTPRSLYQKLVSSWKDSSEEGRKRRVCLAEIDKYLGFNREGLVMKALGENPSDKISRAQFEKLRDIIAGLISIINTTKNDVKHLKDQYHHLGIDKSVF